jgi:cyclic pyranopterin phosphate synthase
VTEAETPQLTHIDQEGRARMVDVGGKTATFRTAQAEARFRPGPRVMALLRAGGGPKGDPLQTARLAGIMAAKRTAELIPLCHNIPLDVVEVAIDVGDDEVQIRSCVRTHHVTGVEMEALTAASVAALTLYDMCKAVDKGMVIEYIRLTTKSGGRSGDWRRDPEAP